MPNEADPKDTTRAIETELDSAVNIYTGFFNNSFIIRGNYRGKLFQYNLPVSPYTNGWSTGRNVS